MRYRLQRHDGTDCSATMVPITVLRMVPIQRYRHVFHKQTGTLLYSLFVSWSFYWQSNGRVDGFTMCILSDAYGLWTLWILWVTVPLSARTWNMTVIFRRR